LYSLIGDQQYTAQYLPELNTARVVELGTVMSESGTHTFELNLYENFDASVRVYLEDRKTGTFHNLNANPAYSFDNDPSFEGNRFRLHFMAPFAYAATGSCTNENTGKVIINNPNSNYPMKARIKNTSGQIVMQKDSVMAEYIFTGLAPQSYTLETSYDQSEYASTLIDVQGFEAFADIHFNSSAQSASIDQAIIEFEASTAVAAEYTWNFGDGTILIAGAQVAHAYMQTGIYTVTLIINNGGCTSQYSSEISITENVTGITELGQKDQLIAFPNPANEQINILRSGSAKATLELSDVTGKVVLSTLLVNKVNTINTAQLEAGTYMATIRQNGTVKTVKVVVTH
jgi:PKD repeat protein